MAETAFSEDGKYFSSVSQDGRLRIWDTETNVLKQEYTPDLHLTSPPSCLQWISIAQSVGSSQKAGRRKSVSEQETQCIALGTTSGKILIYSVAQAKVETVLVEEKNNEIQRSNITSLDWHRKYGLYSCNKEGVVNEWDLQSASVRNKYNINIDSKGKQGSSVSAIKIVPHNQETPARYLVTASTQVRLWRLHSGTADLIKCLGHNASPKALLSLASLNNVCWLVEGSQNERLLSFWDITITEEHLPQTNGEEITPSRKKRKKSISNAPVVPNPTYNFVLEDAPRLLDVHASAEDGGTRLKLAAVTRSGVAHYYGHMLNGTPIDLIRAQRVATNTKLKSMDPSVREELMSRKRVAQLQRVLLPDAPPRKRRTQASTKPIKPSVTIQVTTQDAQPLPLQCCRLPTSGDLLLGYMSGPALLFEKVTPDLKSKTQILIRGDVKESKKRNKQTNEVNKVRADQSTNDVTYVEPMGGVSRKRPTPGGKVEVPMEERLANLTVDLKGRSRSAVNQNLTKLLMQGLHSKDKRLILTVLQNNKSAVALQTVAGLPADYVPLLLERLADMATRKTSQCASVCTWVSAVLRCHSALLLATINVTTSNHLTQLLAIFTHRRSHLCQLLNLKGRLELTMSQRQSHDKQLEQQPVLEYHDTSSDSETEVERSESDGSERMWEERASDASGTASGGSDND